MTQVERVRLPVGEVVVVASVHGLVAEADAVRDAFDDARPAAVALAVAPEAAAALARYQPDPEHDPFEELPDHEVAYATALAAYGDVDLPPPDLREAARLAAERAVPLYGVDLGEEAYEDAFTEEVGGWGFLRYGSVQRGLARKPPKAADAHAFSLAWDAAVRRVSGIARVEARREAHIGATTRALAERVNGPVLLVVDAPRASGVLAALRA
jgi:hypothetical protein